MHNEHFFKTIPDSRIRVSLSTIDAIILKIINNDIENINKNIHDLKESISNFSITLFDFSKSFLLLVSSITISISFSFTIFGIM